MTGAPTRILIVEDMGSVAKILEAALEALGYAVVGSTVHGAEAIRMAKELAPDLVFMDIALEGDVDGIDAAGAIRSDVGTPVVFLTSHSDAETLERARAVEPHGYLVKPLEPRMLRPTVEMALHRHRVEVERQELTRRLQAALDEVEQLRGLLPVCAWCRRVRDDDGYWDTLEGYLSKRLSTTYTHGMCRECAKKFMDGAEPPSSLG
jgi:AmiR/NasT family two-component response regulator